MKRIILSVFAAAVTAAWAIPAYAGDVTFSGQYRLRGEYVDNQDRVNATEDEGDFWAQRVRLTANAKATDDVSAKITIQDTRVWGATGVLSDAGMNTLDLHEAYLNVSNIFGTPVSLRAGRQELAYGDERLIGSFGWSNFGRAFDGVKLMYANDAVNVDVFSTVVTELGNGVASGFPTGATTGMQDNTFSGIYATLKQIVPNNTLDVYFLHQNYRQVAPVESTRYTTGARLKGAAAGVDYTAEGAYQFGETSGTDIAAYAFAVKAGYTLPTPMKIRVGAEYDYATGDDSDLTETEAFDNLFPTNHAHFGIGDVVNTWSDIQAWSVNASADVTDQIRLYAAYWDYTEQETAAGVDDDLGSEIDVVATYKYNNNVSIEAGVARFMPGDQAGVNDDARDWAYLQITGNI